MTHSVDFRLDNSKKKIDNVVCYNIMWNLKIRLANMIFLYAACFNFCVESFFLKVHDELRKAIKKTKNIFSVDPYNHVSISLLPSCLTSSGTTQSQSLTSVLIVLSHLPTLATWLSISASTPEWNPTPARTARSASDSSVTFSSTAGKSNTGLGFLKCLCLFAVRLDLHESDRRLRMSMCMFVCVSSSEFTPEIGHTSAPTQAARNPSHNSQIYRCETTRLSFYDCIALLLSHRTL